jgi:hypothetical protein
MVGRRNTLIDDCLNINFEEMKKNIFYVAILVTLIFAGCEDTNENLVQQRGKGVNVTMSDPIPSFFIDGSLECSYVAFDLSLTEGESVDNAEIEIVFGSKKTILRTVQFPSSDIIVTANEVLQALGLSPDEVSAGDVFYLYVLTTKNDLTTRSTAAIAINVTCEFDPVFTVGKYNFESADWGVSGIVTFEADPDDPFTVYFDVLPLAEADELSTGTHNKIELTINPNSFGISGSKVIVATSLAEWGYSYTNLAYEAIAGSFSSCNGTYYIDFAITVDQGDFGIYSFTFTKQ